MSAARRACGGFCQVALLALARLCGWREELCAEAAEDAVWRGRRWAERGAWLRGKAEGMGR